ncbi:MAG: Imm27 family immunity protein [bacterium]
MTNGVGGYPDLASHERDLAAGPDDASHRVENEALDARIFWLVTERLEPMATANGGWEQLFRDPRDGRLWELSFPRGSLHGGGHRRLACMTRDEAATRYPLADGSP